MLDAQLRFSYQDGKLCFDGVTQDLYSRIMDALGMTDEDLRRKAVLADAAPPPAAKPSAPAPAKVPPPPDDVPARPAPKPVSAPSTPAAAKPQVSAQQTTLDEAIARAKAAAAGGPSPAPSAQPTAPAAPSALDRVKANLEASKASEAVTQPVTPVMPTVVPPPSSYSKPIAPTQQGLALQSSVPGLPDTIANITKISMLIPAVVSHLKMDYNTEGVIEAVVAFVVKHHQNITIARKFKTTEVIVAENGDKETSLENCIRASFSYLVPSK